MLLLHFLCGNTSQRKPRRKRFWNKQKKIGSRYFVQSKILENYAESIKFASDFSLVNYFFYTSQKNSNEVDIKSVIAFALKPCYIVLTLKRLICVPIFHSFFKQVQKIAINYTPISPCSDVFFKSHLHKIWNLESLLLKIYGLLVQPRHFEVVFIEIISRRKRK